MKIEGEAQLVKIFIGETDQWHGRSLYSAIVRRCREIGIAGATVIRGIEGYGTNSRIHTARILRLSEDLPVIIEIVDIPERINQLLPVLDEMVTEGLITIEEVHVPQRSILNSVKVDSELQTRVWKVFVSQKS